MTSDALRIITLNTGKCDGAYAERVRWLAQEAHELQPDLLVCQEVFRDESGELDTLAALQRDLKMHAAWAPARYKPRVCEGAEVMGWSGMALLSTRPWTCVDAVDLPSDVRDGDRVAQVGLLEMERGSLVIANVHLTHLRDAEALRQEQIECVLQHPLMQMKQAIRLICGDFNAAMEGAWMSGLLASTHHGDLRDTFAIGGGRGDRSTLPGSVRCVDFILSLATSPDTHPLFTSAAVTFKRRHPVLDLLPSDHYGVATTLVPARIHGWLRQEADGWLKIA